MLRLGLSGLFCFGCGLAAAGCRQAGPAEPGPAGSGGDAATSLASGGGLAASGGLSQGGALGAAGGLDLGNAEAGSTVSRHTPDASHDTGGPARDAPPGAADAGAADSGGAAGHLDAANAEAPPFLPPTPVGCVTDVSAGVHDFPCDATIHTVSIPTACIEAPCGVIVDVHGGMMSSQMEDENTNLRALGIEHGYIVVQPNALQNPLLLNQRLFVADAPGMPADDTRVLGILMDVVRAFHADEKRLHMTGFSEGGFMTWRWFCRHADLLASVAPGAAAWQCGNLANLGLTPPEIGCEMAGADIPSRNIPVLYLQGMTDGLVDPACADSWVREHALPALQTDDGTVLAGDPAFATAAFVRTRFLDPDGVPFEYIQHRYATDAAFLGVGLGGHCYPGSTDLTVTPPDQTVIPPDQLMPFGCQGHTDFNWGEEVIRFFEAHPKP